MKSISKNHQLSAYGGSQWAPRTAGMQQELGHIWETCGMVDEWRRLKAVLLHRPGLELEASVDPDKVQMLEPLDVNKAAHQHDMLAEAYRAAGVRVHYVDPPVTPNPNQMFVADLMFMTPQGAVVCRPASTIRAGEERWIARCLADIGIPILRTISGNGTFEGADALWIDDRTVLIGRGLRTNDAGIQQLSDLLNAMGIDPVVVDMPFGTMHLMGMLRILDKDLAVAWPDRLALAAVLLLQQKGYRVEFIPDETEAQQGFALNVVTLGPRQILLADGNPITQQFYENLGVICTTVEVGELAKAAGSIGCLTGILHRAED